MGPDQERGQFLSLSWPVRIPGRHHIAIDLAPRTHELAAGGPPGLGKLRRQVVRRPPKRARTRLRMTLPDEGLKMAVDSETLGHHNKRLIGLTDYDVISVPIPLRVNTSRRMAWGIRPSMIWAFPTPPPSASKQACTLGNIPSLIVPFFTIRCTSLRETVERWRPFASHPARRP